MIRSSQRSHVVADTIAKVLEHHGLDSEEITEDVMKALEEIRVVAYQDDGLPLLSVAGRTLVLVMEHPDMTIREIAVRQGVTESNVSRAVSQLVEGGYITRYRMGRANRYRIDLGAVLRHADIWRLLLAIDDFASREAVMTNLEGDLSKIRAEFTEFGRFSAH